MQRAPGFFAGGGGGGNDGRVQRAPLAPAPTGGLGLINIRLRYIASIEYSEQFFLFFFFAIVKQFVDKKKIGGREQGWGGHDAPPPPPWIRACFWIHPCPSHRPTECSKHCLASGNIDGRVLAGNPLLPYMEEVTSEDTICVTKCVVTQLLTGNSGRCDSVPAGEDVFRNRAPNLHQWL